ncbi:MAG: hypothetical protein NC308_05365 [Clostridium sp.]|nr:hypothetical protein [Bacteroides sp.]MCM1198297.1 hypothetical protein [Clostridium sp.]
MKPSEVISDEAVADVVSASQPDADVHVTSVTGIMAALEPEPEIQPEPDPVAIRNPELKSDFELDSKLESEFVAEHEAESGSAGVEVPVETGQDIDIQGNAYEPSLVVAESAQRDGGPRMAVLDAMAERQAWRKDIPGTQVNDVRNAISLNDRILFVRSLFGGDTELFQDVIDRINTAGSLDEAVRILTAEFPEWDFESDTVYRFMMAVRRRLR